MGVITEQVAMGIIKYPEVLREFAVSVVSCSLLPRQCSLPKAKTERGSVHAEPTLLLLFRFLAEINMFMCITLLLSKTKIKKEGKIQLDS